MQMRMQLEKRTKGFPFSLCSRAIRQNIFCAEIFRVSFRDRFMEREGARERAKERESERDLKLSCNLCNFCHLRMRPGKGVDSCHRDRVEGTG